MKIMRSYDKFQKNLQQIRSCDKKRLTSMVQKSQPFVRQGMEGETEPEALFFYPNHPFFRWGGGGGWRFWKGLSMRMMSSPNF